MKKLLCLALWLALGPAGVVWAQPSATPTPTPGPPASDRDVWDALKNIPLDASGSTRLSLSGSARERYEWFGNPLWGSAPDSPHGYVMQRYRAGADLEVGDNWRFFGRLTSSLIGAQATPATPIQIDRLALHQAYFQVRIPEDKLDFTVGRQELTFGSARLVDNRFGLNVPFSFDAVRVSQHQESLSWDAFLSRPVLNEPGILQDRTDLGTLFWGAYTVMPASFLPGQGHVDLYYLGLHEQMAAYDKGAGVEDRHSLGTRLWGKSGGLDYNLEAVYQLGSFGGGPIKAWTVASETGYTFKDWLLQPRFCLKADIASGDGNPSALGTSTFNPLFPRGAYFGEISILGPSNFMDLHPELDPKLTPGITFSTDLDFFWRQSLNDGIYDPGMHLLRSAVGSRGRFIGSQLTQQLEWKIDRHTGLIVNHATFVPGAFIQQTGSARTVNYFSWVTYSF